MWRFSLVLILSVGLMSCSASGTNQSNAETNRSSSATANGIRLRVAQILQGPDAWNYIQSQYGGPSVYRAAEGWKNVVIRMYAENVTSGTMEGLPPFCGEVTDSGGYKRGIIREKALNDYWVKLLPGVETGGFDVLLSIPNNQDGVQSMIIWPGSYPNGPLSTDCTARTGVNWEFDLTAPLEAPKTVPEPVPARQATISHEVPGQYKLLLSNFSFDAPFLRYDFMIENTGGYDVFFANVGPYLLVVDSAGEQYEEVLVAFDEESGRDAVPPGMTNKGDFFVGVGNAAGRSWFRVMLMYPGQSAPVAEVTIRP